MVPRHLLFQVVWVAHGSALHRRRHLFVLKTPEESSEEEINGFAEFYRDVVRFTQLLNGPTVNENQ